MSKKSPFVSLIFEGHRFKEAAMPLEALPELAAYRELVLAVAKALYQSAHPDRQRLPKGFEAGFRLVLDRVESGSAVPIVSRLLDDGLLFPLTPGPDWFDKARDIVEQGIAAASKGGVVPAELSKEILARFNAFGRTLTDEESIIVAQPGQRQGAVYTRVVRRNLVLRAQATYEDAVDLTGEVRAADKDAEGFVLRIADGRKLDVHTPPLFFPLALRSLAASALVRVRGTGLYNAEGQLERVTLATDVSLAEEGDEPTRPGCSTPVEAQVESLKALAPGWYDPSSPSYDADALRWLSALLTGVLDGFQLPRPYIYPTPEGLARAEWSGANWEVVTNFDLGARSADVMAARSDTQELHELTVPLAQPGGESKLGRFLSEHLAAR
jgi:hypothetical protein